MVFVTGGTGLLGSHLLVELTRKHEHITAIYRNKTKIDTVKSVFDYYLQEQSSVLFSKIKWVECDVLDIPLLEEVMEGHSVVYHCAGFVSFERKDFSKLIEINRYGTANMVNIALAQGVEKFCHVSSTAAVGKKDIPEDIEVTEEGKWVLTEETSGYSISKYSAEKEVWRGMNEGLNAVIVNPSVIFGAGDWDESSLTIFKAIQRGMSFYSPGANAFVDARDVARIMVELMDKNIFNDRFLCIGENATFQHVFETIAKNLDKKPPTIRVSKSLMSVAWRLASFWSFITFTKSAITKETARSAFNVTKFSNQKIKDKIGYEFYTIEEAIENAVEYNKA